MKDHVWALVIPTGNVTTTDVRDIYRHDLSDLKFILGHQEFGNNINAVYGYRNTDGTLGDRRILFYHNDRHRSHGLTINRLATDLWWHYNPHACNVAQLGGTVVITGYQPAGPTTPGHALDVPVDVKYAYTSLILNARNPTPDDNSG